MSDAVVGVYTNDNRFEIFHIIQLLVLAFEGSVRLNAYTNSGAKNFLNVKKTLCF